MLSVFSCEDSEEAINREPSVPGILIPLDEAKDVVKDIVLRWSKSTDPEKAEVKYDVYLGTKAELTKEDIKSKAQSGTEYQATLSGHAVYFWKLVATDADGVSSETAVFTFETENSAPEKSVASFPLHEAVDVAKTVAFEWSTATDSDGDPVKYDFFLSETSTFATAEATDLTSNTFEKADLKAHTQYFWKVVAKDAEGVAVESDIYSFTTMNSLPTQAIIEADVVETLEEEKINFLVKWSASTDADGDAVVYDVYISGDETFEDNDKVASDITETEYKKMNAAGFTNYSIKVVAKDGIASIDSEVKMHKTQMKAGVIYLEEGTFTDSRDNHEYKTVTINGTTWMAENLAYLPYFINDTEDGKKCSVYGKPIVAGFGQSDFVMPTIEEAKAHNNFAKYGVMYSAYMLEDIAPDGWHVATDEEWMELERLSGMEENDIDWTSYRGSTMHKFLGTESTWAEGKMTLDPAPSDDFKLNIKPGGYNKTLEDAGLESYTYFWTSTCIENMFGKKYWNRAFNGTKTGVNRGNTKSAAYKMYVRLVKDKE